MRTSAKQNISILTRIMTTYSISKNHLRGILMLISVGVVSITSAEKLTWAPPELEDPETIIISNENRSVVLEPDRDYIIKMHERVDVNGGVVINGNGARNIVWIGGEIKIPHAGEFSPEEWFIHERRGLYVQNWSGTFHIEGLLIHGPDLAEGINVGNGRYIGSVLQLQNLRVGPLISRQEEIDVNWVNVNHPDVLQFWGGPTCLRVDRLTGYTDYQGLMMQPLQFGSNHTELADFRRMDLYQTESGAGGGYMIVWARGQAPYSIRHFNFEDVWIKPLHGQGIYPELDPRFDVVNLGSPPGGEFVPEGVAGLNYVSPGYLEQSAGNEGACGPIPDTAFATFDPEAEKPAAEARFENSNIPSQTGKFIITFSVSLSGAPTSAVIGLSEGPASSYVDLAANVRFSAAGYIDVRDANMYRVSNTLPYTEAGDYKVQLTVDADAQTYSVYVTPPSGSKVLLADNFNFRSNQQHIAEINHWSYYTDPVGLRVPITAELISLEKTESK